MVSSFNQLLNKTSVWYIKSSCMYQKKWILILSGFLLWSASLISQKTSTSEKPNILFILVDDMGYGDIGVFYQNLRKARADRSEPWFATPNLDRMASEGAMLTDHYCAAPVCAPSRASLLSGLSQGQANVRDNQFDKALANNYTLGSLMQQAGYITAAIGKWGLQGEGKGPDWPAHPLKRGFDYYYGYIRHRDGHEHYPKEGIYRAKAEVWENYREISAGLDHCYSGDLWTAAAKKYLIEQQKNKNPFFLYLAYDVPHAALELPAMAYPSGSGLKGGLQWTGVPGRMINAADGKPDTWMDPQYAMATWDADKNPQTPEVPWPDTYKRYATGISRIDHQVGDLLDLLQDLDLSKNTMVVFTSDNGPSRESYLPEGTTPNDPDFFNSFGPFDGIKRDVWEGGIRVPAIVWWPQKVPASMRISSPSVFYDWMPTFANVAGLPSPAFTNGASLLPELTGKNTGITREVYIEYFENGKTPAYAEFEPDHRSRTRKQMQMLRRNDTVAVRYQIESGADDFEFYDISKDPQQRTNLAKTTDMRAEQVWYKTRAMQLRISDSTAKRPYDKDLLAPLLNTAPDWKGVRVSFFKGDFPWLPQMENGKPDQQNMGTQTAPLFLSKGEAGTILYEGWIQVDRDGAWDFEARASAPMLFKLYDINVFNLDFSRETGKNYQTRLYLKNGLHRFRIWVKTGKPGVMPFTLSAKHSSDKAFADFDTFIFTNNNLTK